jgi:hypothetical protein
MSIHPAKKLIEESKASTNAYAHPVRSIVSEVSQKSCSSLGIFFAM